VELSSSKDTLASKQSHLNALLSELAKVRQKHDALHAQYQKLAKNGQIVGSSSPVSSPAFTPLPSPSLSVDQGLSIPASPSVSLPLSPELLPVPSDKEYGLIENPAISFDEEGQLVTDASDFERSVTGTPLLGSPLISFEEGANDTEEAVTEGLSPTTTSSSLSLLDLDFGPPSADGLSLMASSSNLLDMPAGTQASDKERSITASEVIGASKSYSLIVMDETGSQSDSLNLSEEDREREQALKKFYETRVDQLMSQIKEADRKAIELHEEYTKAVNSLSSLVTQRDELQNKLAVAEKALAASKDELDSTRRNYEQQMKVLSEHIVTLNEKIMAQEEQISTIRNVQASGYPPATRGKRGY
jgi:DNA repair exonuclease SbcCD ATPase subunit